MSTKFVDNGMLNIPFGQEGTTNPTFIPSGLGGKSGFSSSPPATFTAAAPLKNRAWLKGNSQFCIGVLTPEFWEVLLDPSTRIPGNVWECLDYQERAGRLWRGWVSYPGCDPCPQSLGQNSQYSELPVFRNLRKKRFSKISKFRPKNASNPSKPPEEFQIKAPLWELPDFSWKFSLKKEFIARV